MTRLELLSTLIRQARANGFEFRKWYTTVIRLPWNGFPAAVHSLIEHRRYYALLFSHEFAQAIWKPGADITFVVPESFFRRRSPKDGTLIEVRRKPYTKRSGRPDAWKYHLQQLALAEEPLRYMRRYIITTEHLSAEALAQDIDDEPETDTNLANTMTDNPKLISIAAAAANTAEKKPTQPRNSASTKKARFSL